MNRSENFARVCGVPAPVVIGGKTFHVSKAGPRAVGELQRWMMTVLEDPRKAARDAILADPGMDDAEARRVWAEAAVRALQWPPDLAGDAGAAMAASAEGQARLLWAVSRANDPELTLDLCRGAAQVMTAEEFDALQQAILPRELGDVIEPDGGGGEPYAVVRAGLCEKYHWTHEYVDGLSFEQIRMAWHGGQEAQGVPVADAADGERVNARWRDYVYGLS